MKISIVKFKPSNLDAINNVRYFQELTSPNYVGALVHASPHIEDIYDGFNPTHPFYSWYPFYSEPRSPKG